MKPARMIINCVVTRNKKQSHKSDINCDTINETQSGGDKSCHGGADILLSLNIQQSEPKSPCSKKGQTFLLRQYKTWAQTFFV